MAEPTDPTPASGTSGHHHPPHDGDDDESLIEEIREEVEELRENLKRPLWRRTLRISLGVIVIIVGLALVPLPGPGWLIVIGGLAILAEDVPAAERMMNWLKRRLENAKNRAKERLSRDGKHPGDGSTAEKTEPDGKDDTAVIDDMDDRREGTA